MQPEPNETTEASDDMGLGGWLRRECRRLLAAAVVGVLAGLASAAFLEALDWSTRTRLDQRWLIWLLPVAGLGLGAASYYWGGRAARGTDLVIDEVHEPIDGVPRRMAPLVGGGSVVSHLVGASVGREGAAVQMASSLADGLVARRLHLSGLERRILLLAAVAGGFGAMFAVPAAAVVFALEVPSRGKPQWSALPSAVVAALVGDAVVLGLESHGDGYARVVAPSWTPVLVGGIVVASVVFAAVARGFVELLLLVRRVGQRWITWPPLRPAVGGVVLLVLVAIIGSRDVLGLSLPWLAAATAGVGVGSWLFLQKLVCTALCVGSGFPGGEVTPLFIMGATCGAALAGPLDLPAVLAAAMGMVAVFAAATKTPVASIVMGVELFGWGALVPVVVACLVATAVSGRRGLYSSQRTEGWWAKVHRPPIGPSVGA